MLRISFPHSWERFDYRLLDTCIWMSSSGFWKSVCTFQRSVDFHRYYSLLNSVPLHDQVRILSISHHHCASDYASAWLLTILSEPLGLILFGWEFGNPVFWLRCSCGVVATRCLWRTYTRLQSWSYEVRICHHDAICNVICCKTTVDARRNSWFGFPWW